jgi:ATP-dependent Clp protease ATP-binding subunit ClpX
MKTQNQNIPNLKELEKEIGDFLAKKFGDNVKVATAFPNPNEDYAEGSDRISPSKPKINFDLKPEELIAYLDQFVVKQDSAKAILSTKICTHFNRIKHARAINSELVGNIKNNVLMIGPTGVGKTYIIKLIAKKLGVPFVKGDATKFSETGYVGGDVEDLVRDLVREANGDIQLAQHGIIYIDEIDKIASSSNLIGADVSRTGVQRALLKPLEETEVDLKVAHDPISMMQELDRFRRTGDSKKQTVNTRNILFIVSGAFGDLTKIIQKRMADQGIGFGATIVRVQKQDDILKYVRSEDLVKFGFESEFVGRLPVKAVFERLEEKDLYDILKNPNNPIILGKKLDFAAYGIDVKFDDDALCLLARQAYEENTGARGLVSAVEKALILFETRLPSTAVKEFPVTADVILHPEKMFKMLFLSPEPDLRESLFKALCLKELKNVIDYLAANSKKLAEKHNFTLTPARMEIIAKYYAKNVTTTGDAIQQIKNVYEKVKRIELQFYENHDINIVLEEDAVDLIIEQLTTHSHPTDEIYGRISQDFEFGLKLVREKTGKTRFFITRSALLDPEAYIGKLIKEYIKPDASASSESELTEK